MGERRCTACGADVEETTGTCPACGIDMPLSDEETAAFSPVPESDEQEPQEPLPTGGGPALVVKKGPDAGERFVLDGSVVSIGRDPASDIFLNDITVSRRHARIELSTTGAAVNDVGSLNGTYVNGERIDEASPLNPGDEIQIGKFRLVFAP